MPTCKKCNDSFPNRKVIDRKVKQLTRRKYCLICSPFNSTGPLHLLVSNNLKTTPSICSLCNRHYEYNHAHPNGHCKTKCNSCNVNQRRFLIKEKAIEYKGGKCLNCGYNKCKRALTFHHRDPTQKDFSLGGNHCMSWVKIQAELDKCDLLCSNCHMEEHERLELLL